MLYVLKDSEGHITAVSEQAISSDWHAVSLEDEALHAFLEKNPTMGNKVMEAADADFIRVLEDVIDLLLDKELIRFTELPVPVQNKLLNRRRYRENLCGKKDTTHLLDSDDQLI
ncbi:tryptophan synthase subunit beta like protein [Candidatus Sororendozoicomonas aggregata]|uniref:tryptophan synthase subunit beta like protein n=1 Tax=Candidatus Sororendozoicomonas aggregata TaxID=3073239 RepID=UPI002ED12975